MLYKTLRGRGPCYDGVDQDCCKPITVEQQKYIRRCLLLANKSNLTQKHGCVLVRNKKIISSGYNFKIHNSFMIRDKQTEINEVFSVHAEISTIKKVKNQDLSNCDMYIVRLGPQKTFKSNHMKYSQPCRVCHSYIEEFGIKRVYYSINCC